MIQNKAQKDVITSPSSSLPTTFRTSCESTTWDERLASVISYVGSPPICVVFMMLLTAARSRAGLSAWIWGAVYLLLAMGLPLLRLFWLVKRGFITDLDVQLRKQRIGPLLYALAMGGLASGLIMLGGAPAPVRTLSLALWVLEVLILGITLRWKVSVHSATSAAAAWLVWHYAGLVWLPALVVLLIMWARLRLQRHTLAQTMIGSALGAAVFHALLAAGPL